MQEEKYTELSLARFYRISRSYLAAWRGSLSLRKVWPCLPVLHTREEMGRMRLLTNCAAGSPGENRTITRRRETRRGSFTFGFNPTDFARAPPRLLARQNKVDTAIYTEHSLTRYHGEVLSKMQRPLLRSTFPRYAASRDGRYTIFDRKCDVRHFYRRFSPLFLFHDIKCIFMMKY